MASFLDLSYVHIYRQLPDSLFSDVMPQGLDNPSMVAISSEAASLIDLDPQCLYDQDTLKLISGQSILSPWKPLAMKYTGHQFGYYNPDLGDGRGLLVAQVKNRKGEYWDLHLKGAGLTPYSRQGDGRAVLRSSIREFLCSEALAALGVPTTRALCVANSETQVLRETVETGATIIRLARSHIRFGHFEFLSFTQQHSELKELCDQVIQQFYPEIQDIADPYHQFFQATVERTAELMAHWQSLGFAHGVMNTDNMSILGDTFDFGPFAFLDDYDPNFICNHSDHEGRYAFNQQPNIANWNLAVLAQALLPLVSKENLMSSLEQYSDFFKKYYKHKMHLKLGISQYDGDDFIEKTLNMLAQGKMDYSSFFRKLSDIDNPNTSNWLRNHTLDIDGYDRWIDLYNKIIISEGRDSSERKEKMNLINPKFILRNYLAQEVIDDAQSGNYESVNKLLSVLKNPFDEQPENEQYYGKLPPEWGKKLNISCSS